jgi:hypothetical protein
MLHFPFESAEDLLVVAALFDGASFTICVLEEKGG